MGHHTLIVGAGSAGCVIAHRLSERGGARVTLVEAGPDHPDPGQLPEDLADGRRNSMRAHDWGLSHTPTSQQIRFPFPRGRVVGGSSAVNTCIAVRGEAEDFDTWAARGLPQWSWEQCLPAFKALERDLDFDDPWHGTDGPLPLRRHRPEEWVPWQAAFVASAEQAGFDRTEDHNRPGSTGVGPHTMNKLDGRRISAAEAWLTADVRARDNLTIRDRSHVLRVVFEGRRAMGVDVLGPDGRVERITADRVVLCAGAIHTPGILLRSGVGPRQELRRLGVDEVAHVPAVGARLLDHPGAALFFRPKRGVAQPDDPLIMTALRYRSTDGIQLNDMQLQPGSNVAFPWFRVPMISLMAHVGRPRGFGMMRWPSADPFAKPVIVSSLLEDVEDRTRAVEAMQLAWQLYEDGPLKDLARPLWPRRRTVTDTRRAHAWIRKSCDSGYHPCGTVPMGADDDPTAATDPHGRVRGTEGLLVADASLMPTVPSSNTNLPTLMIGERIGTWLRDGVLDDGPAAG